MSSLLSTSRYPQSHMHFSPRVNANSSGLNSFSNLFLRDNVIRLPNGAKFLCKIYDENDREVNLTVDLKNSISQIIQIIAKRESKFRWDISNSKIKLDSLSIKYPGRNSSDTFLTTVIKQIGTTYVLKCEKPVPQKKMVNQSTNTEEERKEDLSISMPLPKRALSISEPVDLTEWEEKNISADTVPEARISIISLDSDAVVAKQAEAAHVDTEASIVVSVIAPPPDKEVGSMKFDAAAYATSPAPELPQSPENNDKPDVSITMPLEIKPHFLTRMQFPWLFF